MKTINDVHRQFAEFFSSEILTPYAYLLSVKLAEGNICLILDTISEEDIDLIKEQYDRDIPAVKVLSREPLVDVDQSGRQPFVLHNNRLYLQRYYNYETILLNRIQQFVESESGVFKERSDQVAKQTVLIRQLFKLPVSTPNIKATNNTDWQLAAVVMGFLNNFTIITGGPGTGKTTTVAKILATLFRTNPHLKVALAAPTGKAAARMAESLRNSKLEVDESIDQKFREMEPSTIHRLLKGDYGSPHFRHNHLNPVNADVVIVDESSMIDVALFAKLMDAIGPDTRLILLGDKDQLASVEAGSLFGDLCQAQPTLNTFTKESTAFINSFFAAPNKRIKEDSVNASNGHPLFQHIIELRQSYRFSDHEGIGQFSKAIINNDAGTIEHFCKAGADSQVIIDLDYDTAIFNGFIDGYADFINEKEVAIALRKLNQLRVLCALREGAQGLYALNRRIEDRLQQLKLIRRTGEFYEHRPIMVTSNNYELGLYNGDIGIIRKNEKGVTTAWFEDSNGSLKSVLPGYIAQAETVFVMTIHKSQGSEFKNVLIVLPEKGATHMLTRELLYTGITRARERVILQGSKATILKAAQERVKRTSGIAERFVQG